MYLTSPTWAKSIKFNVKMKELERLNIKSFIILAVLRWSVNELAGPISALMRPSNTAPFEEMQQRWRAFGNFVSDLTGPIFEPRTSHSRNERVTAKYMQASADFERRACIRPQVAGLRGSDRRPSIVVSLDSFSRWSTVRRRSGDEPLERLTY